MNLYCECCHNVLAQRLRDTNGCDYNLISVKVRGAKRRRYVVECIRSVECDKCGHIGLPLPAVAAAAEAIIQGVAGEIEAVVEAPALAAG